MRTSEGSASARPEFEEQALAEAVERVRRAADGGDLEGAMKRLREALHEPLQFRRRDARRCIALLEPLVAGGPAAEPLLAAPWALSCALNALGLAYQADGRPALSLAPLERARALDEAADAQNRIITLRNLARGLLPCGRLREAIEAFDEASALAEVEGVRDQKRFLVVESWGAHALCGLINTYPLEEARLLCRERRDDRTQGVMQSSLAQRRLWIARDYEDEANGMTKADLTERRQVCADAQSWADQAIPHIASALELAQERNLEADFLRAFRLRGVASLLRRRPGDIERAAEDLTYVAGRASESGVVEEAVPALLALVDLGLRTRQHQAAADRLGEARGLLAGAGYRLLEADLEVWVSRFEKATGRLPQARAAAARADELSRCDGEPYAYHWGKLAARRQLSVLGAAEPRVIDPGLRDPESRREP